MAAKSEIFVFSVIFLLTCHALADSRDVESHVSVNNRICATCIQKTLADQVDNKCKGQFCGPFKLTKPYWKKAGEPTLYGEPLHNFEVFERCARNEVCALKTVRNFARMNQTKDCDDDGRINCYDLVRIHAFGIDNCNQRFDYYQSKTFRDCINEWVNEGVVFKK